MLTKATPLSSPVGGGRGGRAAGSGYQGRPGGCGRSSGPRCPGEAPGRAGAPPAGAAPAAPGGAGGVGGGPGARRRTRSRRSPTAAAAVTTFCHLHERNGACDEPASWNGSDSSGEVASGSREVTGSILVDTTLYATTTGNCAGVANGVWAVDFASDAKTVTSYDAKGARSPVLRRLHSAPTARSISRLAPAPLTWPTRSCRSIRSR